MNRSWLRAVAAVSVPAGAAVAGGALLAGPVGAVAVLAAVGLVSWPAVFLADRMALSAMRARPVGEVEYPELYRVVREVSRAARLPVPRVYVSPALQPNSLIIGRSRRTATVCCTEGLIRLLAVDELRGVLGHELAHVPGAGHQCHLFLGRSGRGDHVAGQPGLVPAARPGPAELSRRCLRGL